MTTPPRNPRPFTRLHRMIWPSLGATDRIEPVDRPEQWTDLEREALVDRDGFWFLQDRFSLPREPDLDRAVEVYLDDVSQAYRNDAPLHPHAIARRDEAKLIEHAYRLDFREFEMQRMRDKLPADTPTYNLIDLFAERILLSNFIRYRDHRQKHFLHLVDHTHFIPHIMAYIILSIIVFFGLYFILSGLASDFTWLAAALAGVMTALAPLLAFHVFRRPQEDYWWDQIVEKGLIPLRERYEESVRDAGGLVATLLFKKATELLERTDEIKSRLDKLGALDRKRVEAAPALVRLILWFPERIGFIERYYRVKIDQFVKSSARQALNDLHWRIKYQTKRDEMVRAFRRSFGILSIAGVGMLVVALAELGSDVAARLPTIGTSQTQPPATTDVLGAMAEAPSGFQGRALWVQGALLDAVGLLGPLGLALVAAVGVQTTIERVKDETNRRLAATIQRLEPEAASILAAENAAARDGRAHGHLAGVVLGLTLAVGLSLGPAGLVVAGAAAGVALVMIARLRSEIALAERLFVVSTNRLSANVIQAVIQKMDTAGWGRYNDSRLDEKLADIFAAVYSAWYDAYVGPRANSNDRG